VGIMNCVCPFPVSNGPFGFERVGAGCFDLDARVAAGPVVEDEEVVAEIDFGEGNVVAAAKELGDSSVLA